MVRQQLELFEATTNDIECNTQGRKKPVVLHQVGLRCCHCSYLPLRSRGRGAVYYPAKLQGIYQAAQNMATSHLCTTCPKIPPSTKADLNQLRQQGENASGGKQYWADGCRALGVIETENDGLRFSHRMTLLPTPPTPFGIPPLHPHAQHHPPPLLGISVSSPPDGGTTTTITSTTTTAHSSTAAPMTSAITEPNNK